MIALLAAAAGAAARHAAVAGAVAGHDGSADVAGGGVAHVHVLAHGVGGVDGGDDAAVFDAVGVGREVAESRSRGGKTRVLRLKREFDFPLRGKIVALIAQDDKCVEEERWRR